MQRQQGGELSPIGQPDQSVRKGHHVVEMHDVRTGLRQETLEGPFDVRVEERVQELSECRRRYAIDGSRDPVRLESLPLLPGRWFSLRGVVVPIEHEHSVTPPSQLPRQVQGIDLGSPDARRRELVHNERDPHLLSP